MLHKLGWWDVDVWAVDYLAEHSEQLMGKSLTAKQVKLGFASNVKNKKVAHLW